MSDNEQLDAIRSNLVDIETLLEKILAQLEKLIQSTYVVNLPSNPPPYPVNGACLYCGGQHGPGMACPKLSEPGFKVIW